MAISVALVTPSARSHRTAEETLALGYLASALRLEGHVVTVVDGWLRNVSNDDIAHALKTVAPQVVCVSTYRSSLEEFMDLVERVRIAFGPVPVVCGGYGPTFHDSDYLHAGVTCVVRGEAEHIICHLVEVLVEGRDLATIPGVTFLQDRSVVRTNQTEPICDLDTLPFPARDEIGFVIARHNPVHVCTSRGCEGHCSFCSVIAFAKSGSKRRTWRHRSIPNIVGELKLLYEHYGVTHIKFVDDSFLEPPRDASWAQSFANAVARERLPIRFRTQVRADRIDAETVQALREAGWFATSVGVENAAPSALRRMGKCATVEDNRRALALLRENGVYVQMGMILFDESTTTAELEQNHDFLIAHPWVVTKGVFTEMFAAEGTQFTRKLRRKNHVESGTHQNLRYCVQDPQARRAYYMLKLWHVSHSRIYDWVIDSISAPKVLPDEGYTEVHKLCMEVTALDAQVLRRVLDHVHNTDIGKDEAFIQAEVDSHSHIYMRIHAEIQRIYGRYGLVYDGVPNPFLKP